MLSPEHDINFLIRSGRFADARVVMSRSQPGLGTTDEILDWADLLQLTGDNREADRLLTRLAPVVSSLPDRLARYEEIRGAVSADAGDVAEAVDHFQRGLAAATKANDLVKICRVQLRLLPNLAELLTATSLASVARETRRNVLRLGDPQALASLHLRFAQLEARRGAVDLASRHLKLAWSALEDKPNLWIAALLSLDGSAIKWIIGDYEQAENEAQQALALARRAGHARTEAGAVANLCSFAAHRGHTERARHLVAEGHRLGAGYPRVRMAVLETAAQLALDAGNSDECSRLLDEIDHWCHAQGDTRSWLYMSLLQTRVRLLQRARGIEAATDVIVRAIQLADEKGSGLWRSLFRVMRAELQLSDGDLSAARASLGEARQIGEPVPLSVTAAIERVHAQLLVAGGRRSQAVSSFGFAARLSATVGAAWSSAQLVDAVRQTLGLVPEGGQTDTPSALLARVERALRSQDSRLAPQAIVAAERLFVVAAKPTLLAQEVAAVLSRFEVTQSVRTLRGPDRGGERDPEPSGRRDCTVEDPGRRLTIHCGTEDGRRVFVEVISKGSALAEPGISAVARLVAAAMAVEAAKKGELERESLWPLEAETERGEVFASAAMRDLVFLAQRLADSDIPVLLTGETGVGKEVFAREIHERSRFALGAFVPYNCAAVPRDMLDAQLFGHKRGAFTGASEGFQGVIRSAKGGTLFLDEIGEMALDVQPKLLRFLDRHEVHPLGEAHPLEVHVRVIAATNADLNRMVADGRFREDLLFRLNAMQIRIPPLRDRREEIPSLVFQYVQRYCREQRKPTMRVSDEAMEHLTLYSWPGNIRQLANELRRAIALADPGAVLTSAMLSPEVHAGRHIMEGPEEAAHANELPVSLDQPLDTAVEAIERAMIDRAMKAFDGNLERAAERLGISRKGLFLKRKRLGLA